MAPVVRLVAEDDGRVGWSLDLFLGIKFHTINPAVAISEGQVMDGVIVSTLYMHKPVVQKKNERERVSVFLPSLACSHYMCGPFSLFRD